ncbi:hypothetical protein THAOC_32680 [Thalassiosira oceanica]|uniref:Cyclin-like domain-containing protein n=1 Tax=Thalassiosira oceanica TaxID=159749 RepID=K0R5G1_THAOC|nr:hypothetical protein THAOC_32680 [Thalassiosira oceanica]|eukprot:EJK48518.1 hypothetical protein THAOC_32680 [Thalassiosira oceanica]
MSQPYHHHPQPPRRPAPPGGGGFNRPPNPGRGPQGPPPGPPSGFSSGQPPRPAPPPDLKIKPPASIFDENHLPSVLYKPNPMAPEAERQARRRTCRFIEEAGQRSLRLPRVAVATATVFFHRFYAKHAFQEHDRFEVAMACLLLAGKTEESPKKLEVVIREVSSVRRVSTSFQRSKALLLRTSRGKVLEIAKESTAAATKADEPGRKPYHVKSLGHTVALVGDHRRKPAARPEVEGLQCLEGPRASPGAQPPTKGKDGQPLNKSQQNALMVQELAQNSMNFANDSMHTSLCLQFTAREVGTACVYLGGKYSGIRPVEGKAWVELLDGITVEELATICVQILELVSPRKGAESETQLKAIRKDLDTLSKESAAAHAAKRPRTE